MRQLSCLLGRFFPEMFATYVYSTWSTSGHLNYVGYDLDLNFRPGIW